MRIVVMIVFYESSSLFPQKSRSVIQIFLEIYDNSTFFLFRYVILDLSRGSIFQCWYENYNLIRVILENWFVEMMVFYELASLPNQNRGRSF